MRLLPQRLQRVLLVRDQSVRVAQRRVDAGAVRGIHAGTAILRMRERDQVVHHEYRADIAALHLAVIAELFHAVVAGVQEHCALEALAARIQHGARHQGANGGAIRRRAEQEFESLLRAGRGKKLRITEFAQYRTGAVPVTLDIGQSYPIDPGRQLTLG